MSLIDCIHNSLNKAWHIAFMMNDSPDENIKPEYLVTATMANCLYDELNKTFPKTMAIKIEDPTDRILAWSLWFPRPHDWLKLVSRKGKVDIAIYNDNKPLAIIENKLYISGFHSIRGDIRRNIEFLTAKNRNDAASLAAAMETFYWKATQKQGVLKSEHDAEFRHSFYDILRKIEKLLRSYNNTHGISIAYKCSKLDSSAFDSTAKALEENEDGIPAHMATSPISSYSGIIVLYHQTRVSSSGTIDKWLSLNKLNKFPSDAMAISL